MDLQENLNIHFTRVKICVMIKIKIAPNSNLAQSLPQKAYFRRFFIMSGSVTQTYETQRRIIINEKIEALFKELPPFCREFIHSKATSNKFQPRTRLAYLEDYMIFFKYLCSSHELFMDISPKEISTDLLDQLTPQDIESFLHYCETYKSDSGINENGPAGKARKLSSIRSLFKFLVGRKYLSQNAASFVETPTIRESDVIYMNTAEQHRFLNDVYAGRHKNTKDDPSSYDEGNIIHLRDIAIISIFLGTGIRVSELVGLDLNDVDFGDCSLYVTRKGGKHHQVKFSSDVDDALIAYLDHSREKLLKGEEHPALFISQRRGRIAVRSVEALLKKYTDYTFGTGEKHRISPHKLRSTYATNLIEETNGDINLTAEALGHTGLQSVKRYVAPQDKSRAAINLRLK